MRNKAVLRKKTHWNGTGKPKGELQADTNGSTVFAVFLLPTAHPADIGKFWSLALLA